MIPKEILRNEDGSTTIQTKDEEVSVRISRSDDPLLDSHFEIEIATDNVNASDPDIHELIGHTLVDLVFAVKGDHVFNTSVTMGTKNGQQGELKSSPGEQDPSMNIPFVHMEFPSNRVRILNALGQAGIQRVGQYLSRSPNVRARIKNLGHTCISIIDDVLRELGFDPDQTEKDWYPPDLFPVLSTRVSDAGLPARTVKLLEDVGLYYLGNIAQLYSYKLEKLGIEGKALRDVQECLKRYHLWFCMSTEGWLSPTL